LGLKYRFSQKKDTYPYLLKGLFNLFFILLTFFYEPSFFYPGVGKGLGEEITPLGKGF